MKTILLGAMIAAATLTAAAHAQTSKPAQGQQCFRTSQMDGYTATDDEQTLYIRAGRNTFKVEFGNRCTGLAYHDRLVIRNVGTSNLICTPIDLDISIRETGTGVRCVATDLRALSPEELAALPKKLRP